jgi:hypothetical protein
MVDPVVLVLYLGVYVKALSSARFYNSCSTTPIVVV